ncbi:premnaspirodiene oxygenase-like [Durio zibethinus]|uniref:Premnaspirodiene oxygenase-like n=1 Tax=Durio zibethinus TaxID=66656 RepID=A0A6P5Y0Z6_DURZI|nr:premnaspirodiene oxygenase-like [Durio zibethinus]
MEHLFFSFPMLFTFVIFLFMLLKLGKRFKTNNLIQNLPPGPWKLPVIGNMHLIAGSLPHHSLRDLAKKFGPLMHLQLGEISNIVVSSPQTAAEVMRTHDIIFANRPLLVSANILTYNSTDISFSPYGDYWRQLRKICVLEMLSSKRVQSFSPIREEEVSKMVRAISSKAGSPVNLSNMLCSLTYEIVSRTAFGGKCKDQKDEFTLLFREIIRSVSGFTLVDLFPSVKFLQFLSGLRPKLERLHRKVDKIFDIVINEHKASNEMPKTSEKELDDLLDVLLTLQENGDLEFPLTTDNIKAVILDVFVAGTDTSFTTLEWAMSEMLKNPRVMQKAQAEVRQVFNRKGNVDVEGLHELKYLKLVIKETLRLHPPVPLLLPRECSQRCKINGYDIPVKSKVIINAWAIGRNSDYWSEADRFYPERFVDSSIDYKGADFEFIPFGAGRRMCPGMVYGIANVELPLAQLLYHFDWKLQGGKKLEDLDMDEDFGVVVRRKNDLCLVATPYSSLNN